MKVNWNSKYNTISVYSLIVICCSIIFYFVASQIGSFSEKISIAIGILYPFIIGFAIAYLLNFILDFYEVKMLGKTQWFGNLKRGHKRSIGLLLTYLTAVGICYLFIHFIVPQLIESIMGFVNEVPQYVDNVTRLFNNLINETNVSPEYATLIQEQMDKYIQFVMDFAKEIIPIVGNMLKIIASSIWNIVLGIIISVYLLIDKENFFAINRKIICALFSTKTSNRIFELTYRSNETFGKFLSGKIIDSAIIGVLSFVVFSVFKMPYTLLISVIIGVTNIIPFFGPFIGAIPSFIIILFVSPTKALIFLLLVFIIQQIDGNIIGPKILGDSIGISAFWILFAILVAGKFLGIVGMIIGVPLFAVVYSIIKEDVEYKLKNKELPTETKDYMDRM
ncbi:AI-2E family transporter [Terrisporobacter petrolearius]|uniref:AI-2E family transporter n=1 Tax=Terrisporobacter petrolearius TaxID=1460447 RepID=UPI001D16CDE6|nr:AI-2E family transporter [Terrisporobacter petrolearius]MCC3864685.1 AI-2E family transporter [Terrisporobacter petrolearius]